MGESKIHEANWTVLLISLLINCTFLALYVVEAHQGQREWETVIMFILLMKVTLGITFRLYCKDKEHPYIKYSVLYGFMFTYIYTLITFKYSLTYIFIFISVVLYVMYSDYNLLKRIFWIMVMIYLIKTSYINYTLSDDWLYLSLKKIIQIMSVIFIYMAFFRIKKLVSKNSKRQIDKLVMLQEIPEKNYMEVY